MANSPLSPGIVSDRLSWKELESGFSDIHSPLSVHEAAVAADRCYFCHDAPCVDACPTEIDIPLFIRQISTGTPKAAARTIFDSNIFGGMCARVCPTETLCEEACVREVAEGKPVEIGRLQRFATDEYMKSGRHPYKRANPTDFKIAVIGAGPAGLSCAHRLAMKGHWVTVFERHEKLGGLNEYGIAAYKTVENFAAREVAWLLSIGGITIERKQHDVESPGLEGLLEGFDAVFIGIGLTGLNSLGLRDEGLINVRDAVSFIADVRQSESLAEIPVGRDVVVIGGGMTAVDAAVQSRLLGANRVSLVYRRSRSDMKASDHELDLAATKGVNIICNARPTGIRTCDNHYLVDFEHTESVDGELRGIPDFFSIRADQVLRAIGQKFGQITPCPQTENGKIKVDERGRTGIDRVWAGGDCTSLGNDLTVSAVAAGRDAAEDIHLALTG